MSNVVLRKHSVINGTRVILPTFVLRGRYTCIYYLRQSNGQNSDKLHYEECKLWR